LRRRISDDFIGWLVYRILVILVFLLGAKNSRRSHWPEIAVAVPFCGTVETISVRRARFLAKPMGGNAECPSPTLP
jgi:hypothetical protein